MTDELAKSEPKQKMDLTKAEARKFWKKIRAEVKEGRCDFSGRRFPHDPAKRGFNALTFAGDAVFNGATFIGNTYFCGVTFSKDADFCEATFRGKTNFTEATFSKVAAFVRATFSEEADFIEAIFSGEASFSIATFSKDTDFIGARFSKVADFGIATFNGEVNFFVATFNKVADFARTMFNGDADFSKTTFHGEANFEDAVSRGVFYIDSPSGWGKGKRRPFALLGEGAGAFRLAKQSAANRGDYRIAGKFHYAEQSATCWYRFRQGEGLRRIWKVFWAAAELIFGKLLFGYGERVRGILIAAVLVIFGFAGFYKYLGIMDNSSTATQPAVVHDWLSSFYFSMVTFTTLGYGDLRPCPDLRIWAASEAVAGAFLMALFVVAMARKFTR